MQYLISDRFLRPYLLFFSCLTFFYVSQSSGDIETGDGERPLITNMLDESKNFEVKDSLINWLVGASQSEESFISESLVMNRGLEKKTCDLPIAFTFTSPNKRLIKAECEESWRRFIKVPSQLIFETSGSNKPIQTENLDKNTLVLLRPIKKGNPITQGDLTLGSTSDSNAPLQILNLDKDSKFIAAKDLNTGDPLLMTDIFIGQKVLAARTTIPSGSTLTTELAAIEIRFQNVPPDAISSTKEWAFMETNRNVISGEILRKRHFRKAKLVRRNDPVTLVNTSTSIQIFASGTAAQDGYYGQKVKVKNSESGRIILGKVIGHGRIEINQSTTNP